MSQTSRIVVSRGFSSAFVLARVATVLVVVFPLACLADESPGSHARGTDAGKSYTVKNSDQSVVWKIGVLPINQRLAIHTERFTICFVDFYEIGFALGQRIQVVGEPVADDTYFGQIANGSDQLGNDTSYRLSTNYRVRDRQVTTLRGMKQHHTYSIEEAGSKLRVNRKYIFPLTEKPVLILVDRRGVALQAQWENQPEAAATRASWREYLKSGDSRVLRIHPLAGGSG